MREALQASKLEKNMKKILFISVLIINSLMLFSQTSEWQWARNAGGENSDYGWSITTDNNQNSYVTGSFSETATFDDFTLISNGYDDIFVGKLDENGNWIWLTQAGGNSDDSGRGIACDEEGNCYVVGMFRSTATFGSHTMQSIEYNDIFVAKIDANGNWIWVAQAGGNDFDRGYSIALDELGNCYITGNFCNNITFGSISLNGGGIYVAKIDNDGNWQWATEPETVEEQSAYKIAVDADGNSYVTGWFYGDPTFGNYQLINNGWRDIFIAKLDTNGNWQWALNAGGDYYDTGYGIAVDEMQNVYLTGYFSDVATFGDQNITSIGEDDIFIAKLDTNGNWIWVSQAGGIADDYSSSVLIDSIGNIYITGCFEDEAFFGTNSITSNGDCDIFIAKMDSSGAWTESYQAGGVYYDAGNSLSLINSDELYITGYFNDEATFGNQDITSNGDTDIFVAKLSNDTSINQVCIPSKIILSNYPNPFNPSTTLEFSILIDSYIDLSVFNIKGQKIKTLIDNKIDNGNHSINWNGKDDKDNPVSSGIYFYKLKVNGKTETVKKCILLK